MTIPYPFPWDTVLSPLAMDVGQPDFFSEGGHKKTQKKHPPGFRKCKETHVGAKSSPATWMSQEFSNWLVTGL